MLSNYQKCQKNSSSLFVSAIQGLRMLLLIDHAYKPHLHVVVLHYAYCCFNCTCSNACRVIESQIMITSICYGYGTLWKYCAVCMGYVLLRALVNVIWGGKLIYLDSYIYVDIANNHYFEWLYAPLVCNKMFDVLYVYMISFGAC